MNAMNLDEICRACLRTDGAMCSVIESIVPKFNSPPNSIVNLWQIFDKMLIAHKDSFLEKICIECLNEIQRTYAFVLKCERSGDILKQMENSEICSGTLRKLSAVREHESTAYDTYPDISQIKTETIEWNDGSNDDTGNGKFGAIVQANIYSEVDSRSQHALMVQHGDDNFVIEELHSLDRASDVRKDEVSAAQDIKHEPELDIRIENDEFDEIESEDKFSTEIFICPACRYECTLKENIEKHIIENHMERQLCKLCNKAFTCRAIEHCAIHLHGAKTGDVLKSTNMKHYKCLICSKIFRQKSNLKRHLMIHTGERPFKCESCPKAFRQKKTLTEHLRCHTGERPYKCEICLKTFRQTFNLTYHLKKHAEENERKNGYVIEQMDCEYIASQHDAFDRIISEDNSSNEIFKCPACRYQCRLMESLKNHIIVSHMEEQMCKLCNNEFTCQPTDHCNIHLYVNKTGGVLKSTNKKYHKCKVCSKIFGQKSTLKTHLIIHTGERPFKCESCPKAFGNRSNLTDHIRSHSGEKPFKCEICRKAFAQKGSLTLHLKSHSGERPYKCEICPKSFIRKYLLVDHLAIHKGERPVKCGSCSKFFKNKRILVKHLKCHLGGHGHAICPNSQTEKY